jgi:uncharacterized protein YjbI with pentapeptide repeats
MPRYTALSENPYRLKLNMASFHKTKLLNIYLSRMKLGNACYYSVQNLLSSSLLSKTLKIKIYRTIILPMVLYG